VVPDPDELRPQIVGMTEKEMLFLEDHFVCRYCGLPCHHCNCLHELADVYDPLDPTADQGHASIIYRLHTRPDGSIEGEWNSADPEAIGNDYFLSDAQDKADENRFRVFYRDRAEMEHRLGTSNRGHGDNSVAVFLNDQRIR